MSAAITPPSSGVAVAGAAFSFQPEPVVDSNLLYPARDLSGTPPPAWKRPSEACGGVSQFPIPANTSFRAGLSAGAVGGLPTAPFFDSSRCRQRLFLILRAAGGRRTNEEVRPTKRNPALGALPPRVAGCRGECLPADNSINTGPSEIILNKSPRLCHREMDASPQSRWLLGSGEGTRTESRVPAAAIGARTGGERALAEATGTSAAS